MNVVIGFLISPQLEHKESSVGLEVDNFFPRSGAQYCWPTISVTSSSSTCLSALDVAVAEEVGDLLRGGRPGEAAHAHHEAVLGAAAVAVVVAEAGHGDLGWRSCEFPIDISAFWLLPDASDLFAVRPG